MKIHILVGLVLFASVPTYAQEASCPSDGLEMDSTVLKRSYDDTDQLQGESPEAAADLRELLKHQLFADIKLNEIINYLGGQNLRARIGKAYPRENPDYAALNRAADPSKDELVLVALDNPCASRFAYAAASSLVRSYGMAKLSTPVADEILQRMLARPTHLTDYELRNAVPYVSVGKASDPERLEVYERMFASPAAGALTLGDIAKVVVLITPDPEGWLEKILSSPLTRDYTRMGVGHGIGNSPRVLSNAAILLDQILLGAASAPDGYGNDGRFQLEAITSAIGGSPETIPGEAELLSRGMALFSAWANRHPGLLGDRSVGNAMVALSQRHRRIEGLAEADSALGRLVASSGDFGGFLRGLAVQANGGQLLRSDVEAVFLTLVPFLSSANLSAVRTLIKNSNLDPSPVLQKALDQRAEALRALSGQT